MDTSNLATTPNDARQPSGGQPYGETPDAVVASVRGVADFPLKGELDLREATESEATLRFQAQKELAGGLIVSGAPLNMLGNDMYVLKPALNRIACEYSAGTAQVVANINHLGSSADGVGAGQS